jgi:hypothetical protein
MCKHGVFSGHSLDGSWSSEHVEAGKRCALRGMEPTQIVQLFLVNSCNWIGNAFDSYLLKVLEMHLNYRRFGIFSNFNH